MDPKLQETLVDMTMLVASKGLTLYDINGDSRIAVCQIIYWAERFETLRDEDDEGEEFYRLPEGSFDYMTAVDKFAEARLRGIGLL